MDIAHSETSKDPEFRNLVDFQEKYPAFFDFLEAQEGVSAPPEPLEINPSLDSIPSP